MLVRAQRPRTSIARTIFIFFIQDENKYAYKVILERRRPFSRFSLQYVGSVAIRDVFTQLEE